MKKLVKKILSLSLLFASILALSYDDGENNVVYAAEDDTVKIFIGSSNIVRHHKGIEIGETTAEFSYEINGYEAESVEYVSTNQESFEIIETDEGKCEVKGIKEGKGYVKLNVKTTTGEMLVEKVRK